MTQIIIFLSKQTGQEWGVSECWNQSFWILYLVTGITKLCSWLRTHQGLRQSQIPVAESCSGRLFVVSVIQALWPEWEASMQPPHHCAPQLPRVLLHQGSPQPALLQVRPFTVIIHAKRLEFLKESATILRLDDIRSLCLCWRKVFLPLLLSWQCEARAR